MIKVVYVLIGALAGQTVGIGPLTSPIQFVGGKLVKVFKDVKEKAVFDNYVSHWQAYPEDDPRVLEANNGKSNIQATKVSGNPNALSGATQPPTNRVDEVPTGDQSTGTGSEATAAKTVSEGDGQQTGIDLRLAAAIRALDPNDDTSWTAQGLPALKAVEAKYGAGGFTRAMVDAAVPGFTRDVARESC